jgi:hypothetical protein
MPDQFEWEGESFEGEQLESGEGTFGEQPAMEGTFHESEELELAAELLEVSNEAELDRFLGNLISKAGRAIGGFVRSPVGQALGGILKGAARQALPIAGAALGTALGGPAGGAIGGKLASAAGNLFGLELEGLSGEDQEFEVARRFVRFANAAASRAAAAPPGTSPQQAARTAVIAAARRFAPGLLRGGGAPATALAMGNGGGMGYSGASTGHGGGVGATTGAAMGLSRGGRWIRRGRQIIIFNC